MNILDLIGNTPLMNIGNVYFKMEMMNPSGSIKDRVAKEMLLPYIGKAHRRFTVVEATSGNTGISIAMVCAALGLDCWILCPYDTSRLKIKMMRQYGAKIDSGFHTMQDCIDKAKKMVKNKKADIYPNQFTNLYNLEAQKKMAYEVKYGSQRTLDDDLLYQLKNPNAIVAGTGTGGTLMGLHAIFPHADIYEVQTAGDKPIEGITDNIKQTLIPYNLSRHKVFVFWELALTTATKLMKEYGISCGYSSGANFIAAKLIAKEYKKVLTIFPDNRIRYL